MYKCEINPLKIDQEELTKTIEYKKFPIFEFYCPKCGLKLYEGVADFDMEDNYISSDGHPCCDFKTADLWDCIFTLKGSGIYGIHGLFSNDNMTELDTEEVIAMFSYTSHGHGSWGVPFYSTSFAEVREYYQQNKDKNNYIPEWYR